MGASSNSPPPPSFLPEGGKGRGKGGRKGGGRTPSSFSYSASYQRGVLHPLWVGVLPSYGPYLPPGGSGNPHPPRYSDKYPILSRTLPVSEYYHPIYQYLPHDHFETPRHFWDLIRDTEQHLVTKSHNSYNTILSTNVKHADPTGLRTM